MSLAEVTKVAEDTTINIKFSHTYIIWLIIFLSSNIKLLPDI